MLAPWHGTGLLVPPRSPFHFSFLIGQEIKAMVDFVGRGVCVWRGGGEAQKDASAAPAHKHARERASAHKACTLARYLFSTAYNAMPRAASLFIFASRTEVFIISI